MQAGKSTLGILNQLIDANAASFTDVTTGSSLGSCGFHGGWPATKGCDGVTGVGTPNCAKLATVVTAPPWMRRARAPVDVPPPRAGGLIVGVWIGMAGGGAVLFEVGFVGCFATRRLGVVSIGIVA